MRGCGIRVRHNRTTRVTSLLTCDCKETMNWRSASDTCRKNICVNRCESKMYFQLFNRKETIEARVKGICGLANYHDSTAWAFGTVTTSPV